MKAPCDRCGWIHSADEVATIGRFSDSPTTYRATYPGAPPRTSRADAMVDVCDRRVSEGLTA